MKVLNLYAGIGGNRKLWTNVDVTAIELDENIAAIYHDLFPNDKIIVTDAHQYLLEHFKDYDFIWSSPPCPTHSKLAILNYNNGYNLKYPDMKLYQEIIVLQNFAKCKWIVENVKSYYDPLIIPQESGRHYFWANFKIGRINTPHIAIKGKQGLTAEYRMKGLKLDIKNYYGYNGDKRVLFKNCVDAELGFYILECARGIIKSQDIKQLQVEFDLNGDINPL
jgi:DNA (cytosine-5)-methyltransferase 1